VGLIITLMVTITTLIISQHTQQLSRDMSYRIAEETAHRYSQQVKAILDKSMEDARLLTITFKQLKKVSINRQVLDEILIETTRKGDYVFGSWTLWEPDAYDGLDASFFNKP
jgi:methyl-accepting chemotaxis protein